MFDKYARMGHINKRDGSNKSANWTEIEGSTIEEKKETMRAPDRFQGENRCAKPDH